MVQWKAGLETQHDKKYRAAAGLVSKTTLTGLHELCGLSKGAKMREQFFKGKMS